MLPLLRQSIARWLSGWLGAQALVVEYEVSQQAQQLARRGQMGGLTAGWLVGQLEELRRQRRVSRKHETVFRKARKATQSIRTRQLLVKPLAAGEVARSLFYLTPGRRMAEEESRRLGRLTATVPTAYLLEPVSIACQLGGSCSVRCKTHQHTNTNTVLIRYGRSSQ